MAVKKEECSHKACPTPEIVFSYDFTGVIGITIPFEASVIQCVYEEAYEDMVEIEKSRLNDEFKEFEKHQIFNKDIFEECLKEKISSLKEETKTNTNEDDYMVIYCKSGHRNYFPFKKGDSNANK